MASGSSGLRFTELSDRLRLSTWPLLASGFKPASNPPTYDTDDTKAGGVWKGNE